MKGMNLLFIVVAIVAFVFGRGVESSRSVQVKTRKLWSPKGLPFGYYELAFCKPEKVHLSTESIGEALFGDRIENSVFNFEVGKEVSCQMLAEIPPTQGKAKCPTQLTSGQIKNFMEKIKGEYEVQLIIDKLPFANRGVTYPDTCETLHNSNANNFYYRPDGFPLGCVSTFDKSIYVNNHWAFTIKYHQEADGSLSIVGAEAVASSINHQPGTCSPRKKLHHSKDRFKLTPQTTSIPWSYSVDWEPSDIKWASRWDAYTVLDTSDSPSVHWFSIINATMVVVLLTAMIGTIMYRIMTNQIQEASLSEDDLDESGWKMLFGDVFRPPRFGMLLSMMFGSGLQLIVMCLLTMGFAVLGMANPANRGQLITIMFGLFALMGSVNGYFSLRFYKMMNGRKWKTATLLSGIFFPGVVFLIFFIVNVIVWLFTKSSAGAVPLLSLIKIVALFALVQTPLVFVGGYIGFTRKKIENPCPVHTIPKKIPTQPWYLSTPIVTLIGGLLPFGAVFIEVYFLMSSIWLHKFYVVFGFLLLVFVVMLITSAEISIVIIYFQLCFENHQWQWRSFLISGASSLYLFGYSVLYFYRKMHVSGMMAIVFFEYMGIVSWLFFLMTGSIGYVSTLWFVRKIFSFSKQD